MAQTDIQGSLDNLQQKLKRLLDKHSALQKENRKLTIANENLHLELKEKDGQIKALQQQVAIVKSGIQSWHPEQKKLFVKRIDSYLKEIEKCLALINE